MSKTEEMRDWMHGLWRASNYELKSEATRIYRRALLRGELVRDPCIICGSDHRIHGHHEDYARPLDVLWLCAAHHTGAHRYRHYHERQMQQIRERDGTRA